MEQQGAHLHIYHMETIEHLLFKKGLDETKEFYFTHNEDRFLKLPFKLEVPSFPIHHNVMLKTPSPELRELTFTFLKAIIPQLPGLFEGFSYAFDPSDTHKPCFIQLYKVEETTYANIMSIDLAFRPFGTSLVKAGSNDATPHYLTENLYVDQTIIPVDRITNPTKGVWDLTLSQKISDTWVGESGRGYFVQGTWIDRELTKFFSRLIIPQGKRLFPYYPLSCDFQCVSIKPHRLDSMGRRQALGILHRFRKIIEPRMSEIERTLKAEQFNESHPLFLEIRNEIPEALKSFTAGLSVHAYLNEDDQKEYKFYYET